MPNAIFRIWRGERQNGAGRFEDFTIPVSEGMVVLDAVHRIQAEQANGEACVVFEEPGYAGLALSPRPPHRPVHH